MVSSQTIVYKTVQDVDIHADVYIPDNHTADKQYSAILYLHGGGMTIGHRNMLPMAQVTKFTDKNWIVVSIDYRLIPESTFQDACQDVMDAYQWMKTEGKSLYGIDADNIAIIGSSAGARLALIAGYMLNEPPKCVVSLYGQTDFAVNNASWMSLRKLEVTEEEAFSMVNKQAVCTSTEWESPEHKGRMAYLAWVVQHDQMLEAYFGKNYDESLLQKYSPRSNVHSSYPPTFVIHGKEDSLTPYTHAEAMYEALQKKNIKSQLLLVDGADHAFDLQWTFLEPKRAEEFMDVSLVPFLTQQLK
ncbi:Alpha/Beta hydrolase protein [Umbelopsis sp. AD052]|nr:Alpha/Beta hydrolase protein [Umbelopsis sp. AD052]